MPDDHSSDDFLTKLFQEAFDKFTAKSISPEEEQAAFLEVSKELGLPAIATPLEVIKFRRSIETESDRGCALAVTAYLEAELETLLQTFFIEDNTLSESLLGSQGPLSTLSAKIDLCHAVGLLSARAQRDLHLIRKIRNSFAHSPGSVSFSDPPIASRCSELFHDVTQESLPPRRKFVRVSIGVLALIHAATILTKHREPMSEVRIVGDAKAKEQSSAFVDRAIKKLVGR